MKIFNRNNQDLDAHEAHRAQSADTVEMHPMVGEFVTTIDTLVDEHLTNDEVSARLQRVLRDAARSTPAGAQAGRHRGPCWRRRGHWAAVATVCAYAVGVGNLILLSFGEPTTLTLGLAVVLAPFTLALALKLTAFLACSLISLAVDDPRKRAELLVCAIGRLQPPSAGEKYREATLAEISAAPPDVVRAIRINLMKTAPRIILNAWVNNHRRASLNYHATHGNNGTSHGRES